MNYSKKIILTGTWFYDKTVPKSIEVYRTPLKKSPNRFVYTTNYGGKEYTLQGIKNWADSQPWGPCSWSSTEIDSVILNEEIQFVGMNEIFEDDHLTLLVNVITEAGVWSWWKSNLPNTFQIEFDGVLLHPHCKLALIFKNPKSVSFLSMDEIANDMSWIEKMNQDKLEPKSCPDFNFTFSNQEVIQNIIADAKKIETVFGYSPTEEKFLNEQTHLVFIAYPYGFAISAEDFSIHSKIGEIKLDQLKDLHAEWWKYWRRYWDLKGTSEELPHDYACEVLMPI